MRNGVLLQVIRFRNSQGGASRLRYREHLLEVNISRDRMTVRSIAGSERPIRIGRLKQLRELCRGAMLEFETVQPQEQHRLSRLRRSEMSGREEHRVKGAAILQQLFVKYTDCALICSGGYD